MKFKLLFALVFIYAINVYAQNVNQVILTKAGDSILIDRIDRTAFELASFNTWFQEKYDQYIVNRDLTTTIKDSLQGFNIKVFFGTWCGDSRRELPRFLKVLDHSGFPMEQLEMHALNNTEEAYKQSPSKIEHGLNIHRVPTFIFYKDGEEINRIVEYPLETFERDIYNIVINKNYRPNYQVANYLGNLIQQSGVELLKNQETSLLTRLAEYVKGSKELNTLGYVYLRSHQSEKALYVFDLNSKLFPYNPNVWDSFGEGHYSSGNFIEALKYYEKVLALRPNDEHALKMIEDIRQK